MLHCDANIYKRNSIKTISPLINNSRVKSAKLNHPLLNAKTEKDFTSISKLN